MVQTLNDLPLWYTIVAGLGLAALTQATVWLWRSRRQDFQSKCAATVMMTGIYALFLWILRFV